MLLHSSRCSIDASVDLIIGGSFAGGDAHVRPNPTIIDLTARDTMMVA